MLPSNICRTCAVQNTDLRPLSTCLAKDASKSCYDVLQELTQIDPLVESSGDNLPQHLCAECLARLESAYAFVEQARKVNGELLVRLRECLEEVPIDIPQEQPHIKTEVDIDEATPKFVVDVDSTGISSVEFKWQPESDSDRESAGVVSSDENDVEKKPYTLRRSARKIKQPVENNNEEPELPAEPSPNKRRRGRPPGPAKCQSMTSDGRHACKVCGKTFSWFRDMQRHARIHFEKSKAFVCDTCGKGFLRKDKYTFHLRCHEKREAKCKALQLGNEWRFAERLYSSGRLKRIECKLCGLKCPRIQDLRVHLASHQNVEGLLQLRENSDVIKEHYADQPGDLDGVKQRIIKDLTEGHLQKFASVVNFHGYELELYDSDEESASGESKYECTACNLSLARKHQVVRHTLEEHAQSSPSELPWQRCGSCKIGFLCSRLYYSHVNTQCDSKLKRYRCAKCPGRFMWPENLHRHACSHRHQEATSVRQISCTLCDESLPTLAQLRIHLVTHQSNMSGIDPGHSSTFFRSFHPNGLDSTPEELGVRIAEDFEVQDFDRYYNACTGSGQELDLFDSETEQSGDDRNEDEKPTCHTCLLCGEVTSRLTSLLQHQNRAHSKATTKDLPCSCHDCGASFISDALLQQHRRRICAKKHFRHHCPSCNLRFIWPSNYELHLKTHHSHLEEDQLEEAEHRDAKLQCDECEKVFIWHKDLTRHKRLHLPQSAQFECTHCDRKFHRKDGLKSHLRVHTEAQLVEQPLTSDSSGVLALLSRPHGCKQIQCMICLSRHSKISDLRTHLGAHRYGLGFTTETDISSISKSLYPEVEAALGTDELAERIMADISQGVELDRFISITNEAGLELNLDSSETDTESEEEEEGPSSQNYACNLCPTEVKRKHQLFAHQEESHQWEGATLVCSHCQARFVSDSLLDHHSRTFCGNVQKRFQCRKCPLRFRWRENLKHHLYLSHQQAEMPAAEDSSQADAELQCGECQRTFKMQKDLTRHTLMHAREATIYRCRWCARRFYRWANLLQHIARHGIRASELHYAEALLDAYGHPGGQKTVECRVCNVTFASIAALRLHLETMPAGSHHELSSSKNYSITNQMGFELELQDSETDEDQPKPPGVPAYYTCGMCQLRCVRKFELHQHQQAMHRLEKIPDGCDQCIFKSVCPDLIAHHKRTQCGNQEKQFTCSRCGYKFMWESNLLTHMQMQHGKTDDPDGEERKEAEAEPKAGSPVFQCALCPRKYNRKDRLTAHVKKFHGPDGKGPEVVKVPPTRAASPKEPKRFLCAFCGKAVSSSSNLIIHMRRHTGEKPFKCEFCAMAFPRSSDLQCHRRTHTGERPHVCTVCQKGFARSYKLQQHMRIHSGERPYKCTYCEKSFTQSNDLTLHIRRHTGERPYQCGICGERFIQGTALKNHRLQQGHFEEGPNSGEPARRTVLEQFTV